MHWKSPSSPRQKKARQSKSKFKAMMVVFSTSKRLFTWIGCLKVRPLTRSTTRKFWQNFMNGWEDLKSWRTKTMRQHTTPCLSRLSDEAQDHHVGTSTVLTWPSPMWLFLFPKIKSALKGKRFQSVEAVKLKVTELTTKLWEDDLQYCFQQWKILMQQCRDQGGEYSEGDNISIAKFWIKNVLTSFRLFYSYTMYTTLNLSSSMLHSGTNLLYLNLLPMYISLNRSHPF